MPLVMAELHKLLEPHVAKHVSWNIFGYLFTKKKLDTGTVDDSFTESTHDNADFTVKTESSNPNTGFPFFLVIFIILISSSIMFAVDHWLGFLVSIPMLILTIYFHRLSR